MDQDPSVRVIALRDQVGVGSSSLEAFQKEAVEFFGADRCIANDYRCPWDFLELLKAVDVIVTNKLHVGICGLALGRKVISVPNMPKTKRYYDEMDLPHLCLNPEKLDFGTQFRAVLRRIHINDATLRTTPSDASMERSRQYRQTVADFLKTVKGDS